MPDYEVRILSLPNLRFAKVNTISESPEEESAYVLRSWAKDKGLMDHPGTYRWFGRNNPPPQEGKSEYGYDSMITVPDESVRLPDLAYGIELLEIPAALYAVTQTHLETITKMWVYLYEWVQKHEKYNVAGHGLEELLNPLEEDIDKFVFDLWLPAE